MTPPDADRIRDRSERSLSGLAIDRPLPDGYHQRTVVFTTDVGSRSTGLHPDG
jgi:hypothetical protein